MYIHNNKNQNTYEWQQFPTSEYELDEKAEWVKEADLWDEMKQLYIDQGVKDMKMKNSRKLLAMILSVILVFGAFSGYEPALAATKPGKPKITLESVVNGNAIAITIGKTKNADGYEIYVKAPGEKKYSKIAEYDKSGIATRTVYVKNIKDGKYSVKVKAYKFGKTKEIYGKTSKAASVTVKKETKELADVVTGDIVRFGAYEQDGESDNGKEPVDWIVLSNSDNKLFLLARYALDVAKINAKTDEQITYENCSLRKWLNDKFLNDAFGKEEIGIIADTELTDVGVTDKVFLLSWDEAKNADYGMGEQMDRRCGATKYSASYLDHDGDGKKESIYTCWGYLEDDVHRTYDGHDTCYWWLRSDNGGNEFKLIGERGGWTHTTYYGSKIFTGHDDGEGDEKYYARHFGVRPAVKVNLNDTSKELLTITGESIDYFKTICKLEEAADNNLDLDTDDIVDISKAQKGELIRFGSYEQNGNDADGAEPITWMVLSRSETEMFVVSKYVLANRCYNDSGEDTTWEECTLRGWLNGDFYNSAFSDSEKERIVTQNLKNPNYGTKKKASGKDTEDKVFLLSAEDVTNTEYGFAAKAKKEDIYRRSAASIAAGRRFQLNPHFLDFDEYLTPEGYCSEIYWLRNMGTAAYNAACVWYEGILNTDDIDEENGVRPAIVISLKVQ